MEHEHVDSTDQAFAEIVESFGVLDDPAPSRERLAWGVAGVVTGLVVLVVTLAWSLAAAFGGYLLMLVASLVVADEARSLTAGVARRFPLRPHVGYRPW